jgi:predicted amidohydrolase YtcJ
MSDQTPPSHKHRPHHCSCSMKTLGKEDPSIATTQAPPHQTTKHEPVVTIYCAKKIITMDPMQPYAKAVAVQNGKIYAVGSLDSITHGLTLAKREYRIDRQFEKQTILPGFIEAHCHPLPTGLFWQWIYLGADVRPDPDGKPQGGHQSKDAALSALKEKTNAQEHDQSPILCWGYDPSVIDGFPILSKTDLDSISTTRPVLVINMSGHIMYVNSLVLETAGFKATTKIAGVVKDEKGNPTGELQELEAMMPVLSSYTHFDHDVLLQSMQNAGRIAQRAGCTTIADLGLGLIPGGWAIMQEVAHLPDYPVRLSAYVINETLYQYGGVAAFQKAAANNHDRLRLSGVKFITDGSIQGYTANMKWPYYYDGNPNGLRNIAQEKFIKQLLELHKAGIQCAMHVNGDAAIDGALAAIEVVLKEAPRFDHRLRLEHCQTVTETQLKKMAALGVATNLFVNHIYYWGDFHNEHSLGPDRAPKMNPLASALKHNIKFSLHSDSHVTPINPLFSVWIAAKRQTAGGKILGKEECLSIEQALKAVTIDAAYLLHEDNIKGSIEPDKLADFVILDKDPLSVNVDAVKTINVLATIVGGKLFTAT